MLDIDVVVFHVRCLDIAVEGKDVALDVAARSPIERLALDIYPTRISGGRVKVRHLYWIGTDIVVRGSGGVEGWVGQVAQHHVLRKGIKKESKSRAQDRLSLPVQIPHDAGPGREVFLIWIVEIGQSSRTDLLKVSRAWNEIGEQVISFRHHAVIVPPQAVIEDHVWSHVIGVLKIESKTILVGMASCVAGVVEYSECRLLLGNHLEHVFERTQGAQSGGSTPRGESEPSPRILVKLLLDAGAVIFAAKLDIVFGDFPGNAVDELIIRIQSLPWLPRSRSRLGEEACTAGGIGRQDNDRQSRRVAASGGHGNVAQSNAARVKTLVLREEAFGETIPAIAELIHPSRREHGDQRD